MYNEPKEKSKKESSVKKKKISSPYSKNLKWYESEYFFPTIEENAAKTTKTLFETYKKAHGMASPA